MKSNYTRYLLVIGLLNFYYGSYSQELDGSAIFTSNCAACHTIGQGRMVGPDLKGVTEKYDKPWIVRFIRESQAMIEEGDEKAVAIFNTYSMIPMPPVPLSDEKIDALLAYIDQVSKGEPAPTPAVVEKKVSTPPKIVRPIERKIPDDRRAATRAAMMTGFWVAFGGLSVMGIGIWWATRS